MKRVLKLLFLKPLRWAAQKFSAAPDKGDVHAALDRLLQLTDQAKLRRDLVVEVDSTDKRIIIFSDQHKGGRNAKDDFMLAEKNYIAALHYYEQEKYILLNLGDAEELWKNSVNTVIKSNQAIFNLEQKFILRDAFYKVVGNHDLFWKEDPLARFFVKKIYTKNLPIYEGLVFTWKWNEVTGHILCTHGHQGDKQSDGNAFSKWFVSKIWGPLQSYFELNPNTPSCNNEKKCLHNEYMYEWSARQKNLLLITGHTHQPVFKSLTHLERLYLDLENAISQNDVARIKIIEAEIPRREKEYNSINLSFRCLLPCYFNTGCCCFDDGTITGIEILHEEILLIKWSYKAGIPVRTILEKANLVELFQHMISP